MNPTTKKRLEEILTKKLFRKRNYRNGYMEEMGTAYAFDYRSEGYVTKYMNEALSALESLIAEEVNSAMDAIIDLFEDPPGQHLEDAHYHGPQLVHMLKDAKKHINNGEHHTNQKDEK